MAQGRSQTTTEWPSVDGSTSPRAATAQHYVCLSHVPVPVTCGLEVSSPELRQLQCGDIVHGALIRRSTSGHVRVQLEDQAWTTVHTPEPEGAVLLQVVKVVHQHYVSVCPVPLPVRSGIDIRSPCVRWLLPGDVVSSLLVCHITTDHVRIKLEDSRWATLQMPDGSICLRACGEAAALSVTQLGSLQAKSPATPHYNFIDSVGVCMSTVMSLMGEEEVGVDLEGVDICRHGKICLMQIVNTRGDVFLIDIAFLGNAAFEEGGLRILLQSDRVYKVMFDGRADCDALYHLFGVAVERAYDLQVLHALRFSTSDDRFVKGFQKCVDASELLSSTTAGQAAQLKERGKHLFSPEHGGSYLVWEQRPLQQILIDYAVGDVQYLLPMKRLWSTPWHDVNVEYLTANRLHGAVQSPQAPKGPHMACRDFPLLGGDYADDSYDYGSW